MFENNIVIKYESLKRYNLGDANGLRVCGRYSGDVDPLELFWTGSGVEFCVKASEVWIEVESTYNLYEPWISITLNGARIIRQMLPAGRYYIPVIRNMTASEAKIIRLYKDVQAMSGDDHHGLRVWSILTDGEFVPVPVRKLKLEFIGDSITSGEGAIGAQKENDWVSIFFDSVNNYANLVGQKLDADVHVISQSGWGVLTGWDNNPDCAIPDYYEKLCGLAFGSENAGKGAQKPYDFSKWSADVIVINLGTNDGGAFNSPEYIDPVSGKRTKQRLLPDGSFDPDDERRFIDKCKLFLAHLRYHNPDSYLLWTYGMLGSFMEEPIKRAVEEYSADTGDKKVSYMSLTEAKDESVGSRCHPGVLCHEKAAQDIADRINEILKEVRNA